MKLLLTVVLLGVFCVTLYMSGTLITTGVTPSTNTDIMTMTVGCGPCWEHYTNNGSDCWLAIPTCHQYQKYIYVPPRVPFPDGCAPGAHWDTGCDSDPLYHIYGDSTYTGYKKRATICDDWHQSGNCRRSFLGDCVKDGDGEDARCNGTPDTLILCI